MRNRLLLPVPGERAQPTPAPSRNPGSRPLPRHQTDCAAAPDKFRPRQIIAYSGEGFAEPGTEDPAPHLQPPADRTEVLGVVDEQQRHHLEGPGDLAVIRAPRSRSSAAVGPSTSRTLGRSTNALAMFTRWRSQPGSWCERRCSLHETRPRPGSPVRWRPPAWATAAHCSATSDCSAAVTAPSRLGSWNTIPTFRKGRGHRQQTRLARSGGAQHGGQLTGDTRTGTRSNTVTDPPRHTEMRAPLKRALTCCPRCARTWRWWVTGPAPGPAGLPVPLHVFSGEGDPHVTAALLRPWERETAAGFTLAGVPGGYFLWHAPSRPPAGHRRPGGEPKAALAVSAARWGTRPCTPGRSTCR